MQITAEWIEDHATQQVLSAFNDAGFKAYFVGGCVRNALLGAPVRDLDLSTDAKPEETISVARRAGFKAIPTGIDHGTITLVHGTATFEVTSFRRDVETHGRRAVVAFSSDISDDARRRDFTINALYADKSGRIVDPLGGLADIPARRVRFIEDPDRRIKEDYLRILRYFRFFAWYADQFAGLDPAALAAISGNLDGLAQISKERIGAEIRKLLSAPDPVQALAGMEQTGVLARILPGATAKLLGPVVHLEAQNARPPDWMTRLAALGGSRQKDMLRLSKPEARRLEHYATAMEGSATAQEISYRFGESTAWDVELCRAAALGIAPPKGLAAKIRHAAEVNFPVSAADLQDRFQGPALGAELKRLEAEWLRSGFTKTRTELLSP